MLSTAVLLLNHPKPEKVIRTEGSKLVFESGNYAIVYPFGLHRIPSNPLGLRTYEKFTFEDKKIEQGLYDNNGELFPDDDIRLKNNSFFFYIIMTIMAIYFQDLMPGSARSQERYSSTERGIDNYYLHFLSSVQLCCFSQMKNAFKN